MKKTVITILLSALVAALSTVVVNKIYDEYKTKSSNLSPQIGTADSLQVSLDEEQFPDLTYAAESAVDAVVYVQVIEIIKDPYRDIDPILRFFFGYGDEKPSEKMGSGSGVIIRPDGYIVTNNHVVGNASKIEVTLNDNKVYSAQLIGTDPVTDIAVIKINANNLPTIPMGNSEKLRLGEWVLAIGSPLGYNLRGTITAGIVSAKGRNMPPKDGEFKIESFIQTDAAVNKGNSGGALVDKEGKLVGINTAIISPTGAYSGYSFAVPVNIVKKITEDIIEYGQVRRVALGVKMLTNTENLAQEMKHSAINGVYIFEVLPNSPAMLAGIYPGDIITAVDSQRIRTANELQEKVNALRPGEQSLITLYRNNEYMTVKVVFPREQIKSEEE